MKKCTRCKQEFPANNEYYTNDKSRHDGLYPSCKECRKKDKAAQYIKHREKTLARNAAWRKNNPDNRKDNYNRNKEHYQNKSREWRLNNPDQALLSTRIGNRKYRAKLLNLVHEDYTENDIINAYGTNCYLCNNAIDFAAPRKGPGSDQSFWPDHVIPTSRGGENTINNIRPCHKKCNLSKHNKTYDEYISSVNSQEIVTES